MRRSGSTTLRAAIFAAIVFIAAPAFAEKLSFDYRLSPPLKSVLDSGDAAMIDYNATNPRNVVDVIAVRGISAKEWTEALVIVARTPDGKVKNAADWAAELKRQAQAKCASTLTELARNEISLTLERRSTGCPSDYPSVALYRVVAGKRSLFLLAVLAKDGLSQSSRNQWLALMSSAHLE